MASLRGICLSVSFLIVAASFVAAAPAAPPPASAKREHPPAPREFYGIINQVNANMVVINQIPFHFNPKRDIGPGRFSPGDYVLFRFGGDDKIVMIERAERAAAQAQITANRLHAAGFAAAPPASPETSSPAVSAPGKSRPIRQINGVWTN